MKRTYLEEDVELIQKYFPGAKAVAIRTPFGKMHARTRMPRPEADGYREASNPHDGWTGGVAWTS